MTSRNKRARLGTDWQVVVDVASEHPAVRMLTGVGLEWVKNQWVIAIRLSTLVCGVAPFRFSLDIKRLAAIFVFTYQV